MKKLELIIFLVVLLTALWFALNNIPQENQGYVNLISVGGSIMSVFGVIFAIYQLYKIKSSNDAFINAIQVVTKNYLIDLISKSIIVIGFIQNLKDSQDRQLKRNYYNNLRLDINDIKNNIDSKDFKDRLDGYISNLATAETSLYFESNGSSDLDFVDEFSKLSELSSVLQEMKSIAKDPSKKAI